jgi:uncharacterized phage protein (TIGR01671 family)
MREIKFRAWDKQKKKFDYDVMILRGEACYIDSFDSLEFYKEGRMILMQYTGLKDKNGKEIYEGDIVYHRPIGGIKSGAKGEVSIHPTQGVKVGNWPINFDYEVIGNIYEHPNLLKEVNPNDQDNANIINHGVERQEEEKAD